MQTSSQPKLLPVPFADGGSKQTIPVSSQIGITAGRASYTDGFPPLTRTPLAAGGVPPFGTDFNGVLNDITAAIRWKQSGAGYTFDSTFSTAISGYPKGAKLTNSTFDGFWLNTVDGNTSAPEAADASLTGWIPADTYGVTSITGLSGSSVTLSSLQASRPRITLAGTLSANINLTVPAWQKSWLVENNTIGAFTVTVKTPSGSGVTIPAGAKASIYGNGASIVLDNQTMNVSTQLSGIVGSHRNLVMNISSSSSSATITADELIVETALGGSQYRVSSFSKSVNLSTTGAGGMDAGGAPNSGFVGIYAIYNPSTADSALLAVNATSAVLPEIYSGANMPSGYTASALLSVVPTDSTGKIISLYQQGRNVLLTTTQIASTTSFINTPTAVSLSSIVPKNCKTIDGILFLTSGNSIRPTLRLQSLASSDNGMKQIVSGTNSSYNSMQAPFSNLVVATPQTLYWSITKGDSGDTLASAYAYLTSYTF